MINLFGNIFFIILGLCSAIFHKQLALLTAKWQDKLFHIKYDQLTIKWVGISFLVMGIIFIGLGILGFLGILK